MRTLKNTNGLLISEIKKAERYLSKKINKEVRVTGYSYSDKIDNIGFQIVKCEMCSNNMSERENDVFVHVCTFDRRRSFISDII